MRPGRGQQFSRFAVDRVVGAGEEARSSAQEGHPEMAARACLPTYACYPWIDMSLTHENLPAAIENLSARIIAIRDSL
jgi:hypothetical protein